MTNFQWLKFNFAQNLPHHAQVTNPFEYPQIDSTKIGKTGTRSFEEKTLSENRTLRSGDDISDKPLSPGLPTPISASSSAPELPPSNVDQKHKASVNAIERKISAIFELYETLPEKFRRLNRIPRLSTMRKDLIAQSAMLSVTVENGQLITCLERTLNTTGTPSKDFTASQSQNTDVENIQNRLNHVHKLLVDVDNLSDDLAAKQDMITLPIRPRNESGRPSQGRHYMQNSAARPRGGVKKRRQSKVTKRTNDDPFLTLTSYMTMLNTNMEEIQKQCQRLQPPQHDDTLEITSIPDDLGLTKAVAVMLCKALCQVCPNKKHVHQVLFGLETEELGCDNIGDTAVQFNLAFECPGESETWFIVQSTLKAHTEDEMEIEAIDATVHTAPVPRSSFSNSLKDTSYVTGEPTARFCLQYYKQGTDDLAVALKHSDICEHMVFYPDKARLNTIHDDGQAIPLRKLLEEDCHPVEKVEMLQKVHIARMLAEAVLKFHSEDWLSCKWDWDNVLIYEIDGRLEPHLRFELWSPESTGNPSELSSRSQGLSYVLSQLGFLLGYLAIGRNPVSARYEYEEVLNVTGSHMYAEIFQTCHDMSLNKSNIGDEVMQERFYTKVVAKLDELEDFLTRQWQ